MSLRQARKGVAAAFLFASLFAVCAPSPAVAQSDPGEAIAAKATDLVIAMEYDKARAELAKADPNSPAVVLAKARLALYEEDCDLAHSLFGKGTGATVDDGRVIAEVARGCAHVDAATVVDKDDAAGVVVRWHDEADRALMPDVVDTVLKARAVLTKDLGVEWKKPTRITVVRDHLSLSAMTGLPYESAKTTGTVAVAKWGRVTILSPRASKHGFPWRDTLAHELTHLAISYQSRERAPLWLHEGLAKREETRWRDPGPFDDRPSPETIVLRGMELKLDLPLDKLGPSIAMLPSADAATVAFAEVTSFVRFFGETAGDGALGKLLVALRTARPGTTKAGAPTSAVDAALEQVSGEGLSPWDAKWRGWLARRPREVLSPLYGLGGAPPGFGDSRERFRLAELLLGRDHPAEAFLEIEKVPEHLLADPSLRHVRARILAAKGDAEAAGALLEDPHAWIASFGPCWALRAKLMRDKGDVAGAEGSLFEARAHDPLAVETACVQGGPLCDAARRRGEPDLGKD